MEKPEVIANEFSLWSFFLWKGPDVQVDKQVKFQEICNGKLTLRVSQISVKFCFLVFFLLIQVWSCRERE